jgi:hypothetical protein
MQTPQRDVLLTASFMIAAAYSIRITVENVSAKRYLEQMKCIYQELGESA